METVIALVMFSSAGTAVLLGVRAAHTSSDRVSANAVAENPARNQMEYLHPALSGSHGLLQLHSR